MEEVSRLGDNLVVADMQPWSINTFYFAHSYDDKPYSQRAAARKTEER
jgi:hypothetical protein